MSSVTSTESQSLHPRATGGADPALPPWQLFTLAGLIGATVVVFVSRGQAPAAIVLLSLTVFTAAILGVAAWRTLAPLTGKDDPASPHAVGGRTRAALEREKALVLRSIKELEFDRAMGKVSDKDFAEMSTRLRGRAAGLLRQLDAGTAYREQIEKEIEKRLGAPPEPLIPGRAGESPERSRRATARDCPACGKTNDLDARFCKHCGDRLEQGE